MYMRLGDSFSRAGNTNRKVRACLRKHQGELPRVLKGACKQVKPQYKVKPVFLPATSEVKTLLKYQYIC